MIKLTIKQAQILKDLLPSAKGFASSLDPILDELAQALDDQITHTTTTLKAGKITIHIED